MTSRSEEREWARGIEEEESNLNSISTRSRAIDASHAEPRFARLRRAAAELRLIRFGSLPLRFMYAHEVQHEVPLLFVLTVHIASGIQ